MRTFTLRLNGFRQSERIDNIECFVGEDASGSFGLRAYHERFMTALVFGLARFRCSGSPWQYLALPGALVYFADNELTLSTRRYIVDMDYRKISDALTGQMLREEETLLGLKTRLRELEAAMMRQLLTLEREP